jgi:hypothetical protein
MFKSIEEQPEEVRSLMIYAICQTMTQAGSLELVGATTTPHLGATLLYRNPDTSEVFEIVKPPLTDDEERHIEEDIKRMLSSEAG